MIVRAKNWIKYGATWYPAGAEFEASDSDDIAEMVEIISESPSVILESNPPDQVEPKPQKRGRKKSS